MPRTVTGLRISPVPPLEELKPDNFFSHHVMRSPGQPLAMLYGEGIFWESVNAIGVLHARLW